jgi:hypothetical protein
MELCHLERAGALAWGPTEASKNLIASASVSGTLDFTFETTAALELFTWTPEEASLPLKAVTHAPDRYDSSTITLFAFFALSLFFALARLQSFATSS